jgi:hypothetical protein
MVPTPAVDGPVLAVAGPSDLPRAALRFAKLAREFGRNPPPPLRADPSTAGVGIPALLSFSLELPRASFSGAL